jgi:hypothetical protein
MKPWIGIDSDCFRSSMRWLPFFSRRIRILCCSHPRFLVLTHSHAQNSTPVKSRLPSSQFGPSQVERDLNWNRMVQFFATCERNLPLAWLCLSENTSFRTNRNTHIPYSQFLCARYTMRLKNPRISRSFSRCNIGHLFLPNIFFTSPNILTHFVKVCLGPIYVY